MGEMMNKKVLILFLLVGIFLVPDKCLALDLERSYEKTYTDNNYSRINPVLLPSYDDTGKSDGYIIYSRYGITKYSNGNEIVFTKSMDDVDKDSELLSVDRIDNDNNIKGETDIEIVLTDETGDVVFQKLYGGNGYEEDVLFLPSYNDDGKLSGYVIFLASSSSDLENITPGNVMIKYDLKGNLVWQKNLNVNLGSTLLFEKNDNVYALFYNIDSERALSFVNFSNHSVIFDKNVDFHIDRKILSYSSTSEVDGFIFLVNNNKAIIKYDLDGNIVFNIDFNTDGDEGYIREIIPSKNLDGKYDGFFAIGTTNSDYMAGIYKYDSNGKLVWHGTYAAGKAASRFTSIIESYDDTGRFNGYILAGIFYNKLCVWRKNENVSFTTSGKVKKLGFDHCTAGLMVARYTYPSYEIVKDNNENGDITISNDKAYPGEVVRISATPKEGYSLKRIVVIDESGKEIEVRDDGTFIMPEGKVTVTALYNRISNPETVSTCYVVLGIILAISIGTLIVTKNKENV